MHEIGKTVLQKYFPSRPGVKRVRIAPQSAPQSRMALWALQILYRSFVDCSSKGAMPGEP
jgi:hypothetical protein